MVVYPKTGYSELSTTTNLGSVSDTTMAFSNLGLAIVQTSEVISTSTIDFEESYIRSRSTNMLDFQINTGSVASIDYSGEKSNYLLYTPEINETNSIAVNYMNLLHQRGDDNRTLFTQTSERIGVFLADNYQNDNFEYIYDKYLVLTSYPKWDGHALTHDPAFSAIAALAAEDSTDEISKTSSEEPAPIPGFGFFILFVGILSTVFFQRKR